MRENQRGKPLPASWAPVAKFFEADVRSGAFGHAPVQTA